MVICLLAYRVDSLTYTIAKALSFGGYNVFLQTISQEHVCDIDTRLGKILASTPGVTINTLDVSALPPELDHLIVQGHQQLLKHRSILKAIDKHVNKLTIISSGDRKLSKKQAILNQWRELRWYGRTLLRVKRVVYKDGFYPVDLFGLFIPRRVVGFDVHSKFLTDQEAFRQIHTRDWDIKARRPILANFLGSRDPARRASIIDSVQPLFTRSSIKKSKLPPDKTMFWHMYTDDSPAVLSTTEYLDVLSQSDYTLCPPGYSLVTHRPLEAMLRGSIPILNSNELDLYDIGLQDGVNCIGVEGRQWPEAIDRIIQLDESTVISMRRNIFSMLADCLDYTTSSERMRIRLGLNH